MSDLIALAIAGACLVLVGMLLGTSISDRHLRSRTQRLAELRRDVNERLRDLHELESRLQLRHRAGGVTWRRAADQSFVVDGEVLWAADHVTAAR